MSRVLYVSYDGALDPLGRSQVLPYLEGLSKKGHEVDLVTFEKPERWEQEEVRDSLERRLGRARIRWHPLRYHKRPPVLGTARDLWTGTRLARRVVRDRRIELVHARSYPSCLIALRVRKALGIPYVFDIRGLYPEERVDGGLWREGGLLYRLTKRLERGFLRHAAAVVTLTEASLPHLEQAMAKAESHAHLEVIPTCVDLARFPVSAGPEKPFTLAYFGSIGTWYLLDEMLRFADQVLAEAGGGRLLFLTNGDPAVVRARAESAGFPADALEVDSVPHEEVPGRLAGVAATFFFIRPGPSRVGFHQTKFGESLALGIPVAANRGIGDTSRIIEEEGVGVVVEGFDEAQLQRAARKLVELSRSPEIRRRCRRVAEEGYDLADGVERYHALYRRVLS